MRVSLIIAVIIALFAATPAAAQDRQAPGEQTTQDRHTYPGEQTLDTAGPIAPYLNAALAASEALFGDHPQSADPADLVLLSAPDLGTRADGQPAYGRGGNGYVWIHDAWLAVALNRDRYSAATHRGLCLLVVHEIGHAIYNLPHDDSAPNVMHSQTFDGVHLSACDAAFPDPVAQPAEPAPATDAPPVERRAQCRHAPSWTQNSTRRVRALWQDGRRHSARRAFARFERKHPRRARAAKRGGIVTTCR